MTALFAPILTWIMGPFLAFAKGLGASIGQIVKAILGNPVAMGACAAAALFLLYNWEEGGKAKLRAQVTDPATGHSWKAEAQDNAIAAALWSKGYGVLLKALTDQTGAVVKLNQSGALKIKASAKIAGEVGPSQAAAAKQSAAIRASTKGDTGCAAAADTFAAARKALQ